MTDKYQPTAILVSTTNLQVVSDHPRETQGGIVSVRCKGPGSKNQDGSYSVLWVEVVAKGDLGVQLASAKKGDRLDVAGELRAGRDYTTKAGEPAKGGPVIWASGLRYIDGRPSQEPAHDFEDQPIPF